MTTPLRAAIEWFGGGALEQCPLPHAHVLLLWLLPTTEQERASKVEHGFDTLEDLFETKGPKTGMRAVGRWRSEQAQVVGRLQRTPDHEVCAISPTRSKPPGPAPPARPVRLRGNTDCGQGIPLRPGALPGSTTHGTTP